MKEALTRMVKIAMKCKELDKLHTALGYDNTPYFDLYGNAVDAIYFMIGEHTATLEESVTYRVLNTPGISVDERVKKLMEVAEGYSDVTISLPVCTLQAVSKCASHRNMDYQDFMKLIINEWALNHERSKACVADCKSNSSITTLS